MNHFRLMIAVVFVGSLAFGTAFAQAQQPAPKPAAATAAPAASPPSMTAKVETWTKEKWAKAEKEWAKDKAKLADCRKQSKDQKLSGRKSWSFLYDCMAATKP
jgi:hypothetical protein